ncbi:MAG TPA: hypothetical protein VGR60_09060, partial [Gemmatimonadales bacterium]|nr:hypothetical protein [Gemmatimonadales bacterium]
MSGRPTETALAELAAPARRRALAGAALATVGGVTSVFAVAAWALRLHVAGGPGWVLASWAAAASAILAAGCSVPLIVRRTTGARLAARLESTGAWRRGALTAFLGVPALGTS